MLPLVRRPLRVFASLVAASALASGQAQLSWHQLASTGNLDDPMPTVAFGPGGASAIAGRLRVPSGSIFQAWVVSRDADGALLGSAAWPPQPASSHRWIDVDLGPNGDIAVVGAGPDGPLVARCTSSCAFVFGPLSIPAPCIQVGAVAFDASGDLLVAGSTSGLDVFVARYSPAGALIDSGVWAHPEGGADYATSIEIDASGDVLVAGVADLAADERAFVLRLNPSLDFAWYAERLGLQNSAFKDPTLALDGIGNAYVACGVALQGGSVPWVFSLWKLSPDGSTAWLAQSSDAGHPFGRALDVAIDASGNVAVAGWRFGGNDVEGLLQSYDAAGALRWSRVVAGPDSRYKSVAVDPGGDVLVAGWSGSPKRAISARFDRDGNPRWSHVDSADWSGQGTLGIGVGVAPGGGAIVGCSTSGSFGVPHCVRWYRLDAAFFPTCEGDGSLAACPCGNHSDPAERAGCVHSQGGGGRLDGAGYASLAADTLVLVGSTMPNTFVLYFQGDALIAPAPFGDGLRCAGGSLIRLGLRTNVGGGSTFPSPGDPTLSATGLVGAPSTRWYQAWYRDPTPHCTGDTFNASNALRVAWIP